MKILKFRFKMKSSLIDSVDWIVTQFGIDKNTHVADFGCGMGQYTTRFAEKEANVTGIDFSERFIRHANRSSETERSRY